MYQASAQVLLNRENLSSSLAGLGPDPTLYQQPQRIAATQASVARVPQIAARTLAAAKLKGRTVKQFLKHSKVTSAQDLDLLTFDVTDHKKAFAIRLATEYAHQYTLYRRHLDTLALDAALAGVDKTLGQLAKHGDKASALYGSLIDKHQQLLTLKSLQAQNAVLVRPANSAAKVEPRTVRNAVFGGVIGLMFGALLVFLAEAFDTRVRTADGVSELLGIPLLGRLPAPPRRLSKRHDIVMLAEPNSFRAEPFRVVRAHVDFANIGRGAQTVMITSAVEGEGKSTTAANLAIAFARAGRRVVLVDMDMRRPSLERFFVPRENPSVGVPGLMHVIHGRVTLDEALVPVVLSAQSTNGGGPLSRRDPAAEMVAATDRIEQRLKTPRQGTPSPAAATKTLALVTAGAVPPDPGEFVASKNLDRILAELKERADIVLIDSPPLLSLSDGFTLSEKVDALIMVCRLEQTRHPMLAEVKRLLDASPAVKLGLIVTGAEIEGGYYQRYGRGYGHRGQVKDEDREEEEVG